MLVVVSTRGIDRLSHHVVVNKMTTQKYELKKPVAHSPRRACLLAV